MYARSFNRYGPTVVLVVLGLQYRVKPPVDASVSLTATKFRLSQVDLR